MPWWDASTAAAGGLGFRQPVQQPGPCTAAACIAATASGLAAAALDPTAAALDMDAEQGQQVAGQAYASIDLAGGLSEVPEKASPSSLLAPTASRADPSTCCLVPVLPAQAAIREKMFVSPGFQRRVEADYDER
ncbi:TPA: hypothetical protein ACH3X1_007055 [Trebouxia sp. C0004]